jgi:choline dehydrogenase
MFSGVGPADLLERLSIPVVENLPRVAQNLQDHLRLSVIYRSTGRRPDAIGAS